MPTEFDPRAFVRVDIGYDEHPKVAPLTDAAFRAHVEAMTWCGRNTRQNGRITKRLDKESHGMSYRIQAPTHGEVPEGSRHG